MNKAKIKNIVLVSISVIFLIILASVMFLYAVIYKEVRSTCIKAQVEYKTNCVDSLIYVLESDEKSAKEKNDAIWALGQIADQRGLLVLKKLYTGDIPDREPLDQVVSQYEIKKAIHWIENGNWTSWMYFQFH